MGEVAKVVGGSTPKTGEPSYWGGDIPWITPDDLSGFTGKYIERGRRGITEAGYGSCSTQMVPAPTVLFTSRAPIGYVAIAANPICTNQGFKSFVCGPELDPDYAYWYLRGSVEIARSLASGTTFLELSTKAASRMPIPLPPPTEQRAIVAVIEQQATRIEQAHALITSAKARLGRLRDMELLRAFDGHPWRTLLELCAAFADCEHRTPKYGTGSIPALRPRDVVGGTLDVTNAGRVSDAEYHRQTRRHIPAPGDIVYSRELSYGWAAELNEDSEVCLGQGMVILRPGSEALAGWITLYLNSPEGRQQAKDAATGSAHPHINLTAIRNYRIPAPALATQHAVLARITARLEAVDRLAADIEVIQGRTSGLMREILQTAFQGKVQYAEAGVLPDAPATAGAAR
jgi:type I restriction enzyme S subunit